MELQEKVDMLHGWAGTAGAAEYVGYVAANTRLNIPAMTLNDGPQGFRSNNHPGTSTAFPAGMTIGATWDRGLAEQWGAAMGAEFSAKGSNVQLGPGMNLARVPQNGRNFEYCSGADPYLGYEMVGPVVQGIQSAGVIANAKHYVHNNQETNRDTVSAEVDERTRHELYYRPFAGAVDAGVGSIMCSYNLVNGVYACENPETLNTDLKGHLGFDGWVMSDWGATHSTSIAAGLDQQMPDDSFFGAALLAQAQNGTVPASVIDGSLGRILRPMFQMGLFDKPNNNAENTDVTSPEASLKAQQFAAAAQILLKNEGHALPLSLSEPKKILLVGQAARTPIVAGGGSGAVFPKAEAVISPWAGFLHLLGLADPDPQVVRCDPSAAKPNKKINQWGCESLQAASLQDCATACENYAPCNAFSFQGTRCNFYPTYKEVLPAPNGPVVVACIRSRPEPQWVCTAEQVCVAVVDGTDDAQTQVWAAQADVAIAFVAQFAKEGTDRPNLRFDLDQTSQNCQLPQAGADQMVSTVAKAAKQTVVAATAPGAALTPWRDLVDAIVYSYIPGQGYGAAIADVVFGNVNPSAKLTVSLPLRENDQQMTKSQYPGVKLVGEYSEGMYIDYRWYTQNKVTPAFPFGHGLSYTTFAYSDLVVDSAAQTVSAKVTNSGAVAGAEVAQLYLGFPESADTPPIQLKGFVKTAFLAPGAAETVTFKLNAIDLSVWNATVHAWQPVVGTFGVSVGASVADPRLTGSLFAGLP